MTALLAAVRPHHGFCVSHQIGHPELRLADAVIGMSGVLRGDVNPLVENDMGDRLGHDLGAAIPAEPVSLWTQHPADAGAVDVDEWLNSSFRAAHPAQRDAKNIPMLGRGQIAVPMQKDGDG